MSAAIRRLSVDQFKSLLNAAALTLTRRIDSVHLHHTWRPTRAQFKGLATIEAMRTYHVTTNGWRDIAQHLTIDPQGFLWTGRNWNWPPASQSSKNGTAAIGPIMIEVVGDFDAGRDSLDGEQRSAVVAVIASLLEAFDLGDSDAAIHFHCDLGSPKSCPGSGVDRKTLIGEIDQARGSINGTAKVSDNKAAKGPDGKPQARAAAPPFGVEHWLGYQIVAVDGEPEPDIASLEVTENELAARSIASDAAARVSHRARASHAGHNDPGVLAGTLVQRGNWDRLRPYVINLSRGRLSQSGEFSMPDGAIEGIVDSIRAYAVATPNPRLMIHAHGGLVSEKSALEYADASHRWWRDHAIYPIYFVWETGLLDVLKQRLGLTRGPIGDTRDRIFEATARAAGGKFVWSDMKESARLASSTDAGDGEAGGARKFAEALAPLSRSDASISIHAVGHSAGAIFHAHLLPLLLELGLKVDSLAFLAPAIRVDLFKQMLLRPILKKDIKAFEMFTMDEEAERDDDCVEPLSVTLYGKSLLYLVSRAFEPKRKTPILGLEEMFRVDAEIEALFQNGARLELARARGKLQNPHTQAKRHGCFDNDDATMASVLTTIAGQPPLPSFPATTRSCSGERTIRGLPASDPSLDGGDLSTASSGLVIQPQIPPASTLPLLANRRGRALCVGIDNYAVRPLGGCVSDANTWARVLRALKFDVTMVLDREATRQTILDALKTLVVDARPNELLVFQFSGHGSQADDVSGDEKDRFDEALVPIDFHTGALLIDDDLAEIYRQLPTGAVLTLFMDCCHSGTNSRFSPIVGRGAFDPTEKVRFLELTPDVQNAHRAFRARYGSSEPTRPEESLQGVIHFAACLDDQFAYESGGQGHFTRVAASNLAQAVAKGTLNEDFGTSITSAVTALGRPQTPRLMKLPPALAGRALLMQPSFAGA